MTPSSPATHHDGIAAVLSAPGPCHEPRPASRWLVETPLPGCPLELRALENWLVVSAIQNPDSGHPKGAPAASIGWEQLLRWNAALAGQAKFVLQPSREILLCAEIPWLDEADPAGPLRAACAGISQGWQWYTGSLPDSGAAFEPNGDSGVAPASTPDLESICVEAGWPVVVRPDGRLTVSLATAEGSGHATLLPRAGGGCQIRVEIIALDCLPPIGRQAVAVLLLLAGASVRLARPVIFPTGEETPAGFEVIFSEWPAPLQITEALASLSVACGICSRETPMLCHEQTARDYLEVGGWLSNRN